MQTRDYRDLLASEYEERCRRNSHYSLRAFARDLNLGAPRLSDVLNYKSGLSKEASAKIAERLGYNEEEKSFFCTLVESQHARSRAQRKMAHQELKKINKNNDFQTLKMDSFRLVSDWHHFAILELTYLSTFKSDVEWIAKTLGIQKIQAELAIDRLKKMGMLEEKNGRFVAKNEFVASPSGVPSSAIKQFHRKILEKALSALYLQPVGERDYSSILMAIDEYKLPQAKIWIKEFRRQFCKKLSRSKNKNKLYCLSVQFFNMGKKE